MYLRGAKSDMLMGVVLRLLRLRSKLATQQKSKTKNRGLRSKRLMMRTRCAVHIYGIMWAAGSIATTRQPRERARKEKYPTLFEQG
jgi:hypothetical protein